MFCRFLTRQLQFHPADIIHRKGFNHAGLQEILTAAGVPKGSFYNHFKSKEDFGLQVIAYFSDVFHQHIGPIFDGRSLSPLKRLARVFDFYIDYFNANDHTCGCPVGNLAKAAQQQGAVSTA